MTTTPERTATLTALVAAEIRAQMGRLNVRQSELARRMGENDTWVHTRLKGPTPIDLNDLVRFARALDIGVYDLMPTAEVANDATAAPPAKPSRKRGREDGIPKSMGIGDWPVQRPLTSRPKDNRPTGHPRALATPGVHRSALIPRNPRRDRP